MSLFEQAVYNLCLFGLAHTHFELLRGTNKIRSTIRAQLFGRASNSKESPESIDETCGGQCLHHLNFNGFGTYASKQCTVRSPPMAQTHLG